MLCPNCGKEVGDKIGYCESCHDILFPKPQPVDPDEESIFAQDNELDDQTAESSVQDEAPVEGRPAGFWLRFIALMVDGTLAGILPGLITLLVGIKFGLDKIGQDAVVNPTEMMTHSAERGYGLLGVLQVVLTIGYFVVFETSRFRATPGKMLLGLKVADLDGSRLQVGTAIWRTLVKYCLTLVPTLLGVLFLIPGLDIAAFVVIGFVTFGISILCYVFTFINAIYLGVNSDKRGIHDRWFGSKVIVQTETSFGRKLLVALFALFLPILAYIVLGTAMFAGMMMSSTSVFSQSAGKFPSVTSSSLQPSEIVPQEPAPEPSPPANIPEDTSSREPGAFVADAADTTGSSNEEKPTEVEPTSLPIDSPQELVESEVAVTINHTGDVATPEPVENPVGKKIDIHSDTCSVTVGAQTVFFSEQIALAYPKNNRIDIGFYSDTLSDVEREAIVASGNLAASRNAKRPAVILILVVRDAARELTPSNVVSYSVNFYRDARGSLQFDGFDPMVQFFRGWDDLAKDEVARLSGHVSPGGSIAFRISADGKKKSLKSEFSWNIIADTPIHIVP